MAETFTAQMSATRAGVWRVYVVLYGVPEWPEYSWARTAPVVPTPPERALALESLGFEVLPDAEWEWIEYSKVPDDPSSRVCLLAAVSVRRMEVAL
ncbi:hypothetical protein DDE74_11265 [Streptomyces lydicus]|uniref:Uncharacterized protein n=1 Tax=Streptomyces lydicus TaxID=47763 RepID=A0A3Q9K431_9ACTN|nr:DUF6303 family protein [Streptomyces lydicus]AZS71453.1 hypothetical protein DDE74_11265 [Streptomyces lydicus]